MKARNMSTVIPSRFLITVAHLVIVITLLWSRDANVRACLPLDYSVDEYHSKENQLVVGLSLAVVLIIVELLSFFAGISMFAPTASLLSILGHGAACISLSYFVLDEWDCDLYWWIFGICSLLPIIAESAVLVQVLAFKKGL